MTGVYNVELLSNDILKSDVAGINIKKPFSSVMIALEKNMNSTWKMVL
jgi:hypothetical protein